MCITRSITECTSRDLHVSLSAMCVQDKLDAQLREQQREVLRQEREEEMRRKEDEAEQKRQRRREEAITRKKGEAHVCGVDLIGLTSYSSRGRTD